MTMPALDQLRRFQRALGIRGDEPWLAPPATAEGISNVESWLGRPLPEDLRDLLAIHDGGTLAGIHPWMGCSFSSHGLIAATEYFRESILSLADVEPEAFDLVPGPDTLVVTATGQRMILYDLDDRPGRLLFVHTLFSPVVVPLASSLERYFTAWAAVAEAGLLERDEDSIYIPSDEVAEPACRILLDHAVAPAPIIGTGTWVLHPEYRTFQLR